MCFIYHIHTICIAKKLFKSSNENKIVVIYLTLDILKYGRTDHVYNYVKISKLSKYNNPGSQEITEYTKIYSNKTRQKCVENINIDTYIILSKTVMA